MKCSSSIVAGALVAAFGIACARPARPLEPVLAPAEPPRLHSAELSTDTRAPPASGSERAQASKNGFVQDIERLAEENHDFRRVLYTAGKTQLVVMALPPGEHIGAEVHDGDQFLRIEEGAGEVVIGGRRTPLRSGSAVVIPAGTKHDVVNTGSTPLQLYTIYSPPHHRDGVVHHTRADAERDNEHFDGKTTE